MSEIIGWTDLVSGLIGASAAGGFGVWDRYSQQRRKRRCVRTVVLTHIGFLTELVRNQGYEADALKVVEASNLLNWEGRLMSVDIPSHYLDGLKAGLADAGELDSMIAKGSVEFLHRAQIFIDSTRVRMDFHSLADIDSKRSHALETHKNIRALLEIGEQLTDAE